MGRTNKIFKIVLIISFGLIVVLSIFALSSRPSQIFQVVNPELDFPEINHDDLGEQQRKIISLLRQEWQDQPEGIKYSDGIKESWCADFVSWVMKQADQPFINPNSGSWRIPGVYTLAEYYQSIGKWQEFSDYQPKVAETMIYKDSSRFGGHTNFVLSLEKGYITTVGGNENNRIRVQKHKLDKNLGIRGFGKL